MVEVPSSNLGSPTKYSEQKRRSLSAFSVSLPDAPIAISLSWSVTFLSVMVSDTNAPEKVNSMSARKQFIVIGLGVFGATVARELAELGHDVLGIDINEDKVNQIADEITCAVTADASLESTLQEVNAGSYDAAVIAIGNNFETSVLATMQLKALGVEGIWAKAMSKEHHLILERLGATRVIAPEYETGVRISREMAYPMVHNYLDLEDDYFVVDFRISDEVCRKSLAELLENLPLTLLMLKRGTETFREPDLTQNLHTGDRLVVGGAFDPLRQLADEL
ncbi:MAG: K+ uptake system protein [Oceanospirillaceae bacterium]|nr:K+ uptake system protein [Oceanospirillaceae bacterium]